ncbi:monothiol glutaredoxin-5 [Moniliophthora roreri MCA 2997]|uniref:Monothiol glutaredoxin-5, mitochondrial n=1 Tax=Moniliophthora roreri (strain MCA 2997) TaxID=1381753 RepID=V2X255_MONRO|nr:monothiol glutaredoxin-5 [Moniliophthora roreri MCA 2997]
MTHIKLQFNTVRPNLLVPSFAAAQRRFLSQDNRAKLQEAVKAKPVVLFMKGTPDFPECGFSRAAVQILGLQGVEPSKMQTYNVLADSELRQDIKEFSDWPTIPQLYVNGEFVGGCDILLSMHQSGELEKFLTENKVITPEEQITSA